MGLSCDYESDWEPGMTAWNFPANPAPLQTKRGRKCASCRCALAPGAVVTEWRRYKVPEYEIELAIYGEDGDCGPPRASAFHCADCTMLAAFLSSFKYAFQPDDDMRALAREHAELIADGGTGCL